MNKRNAHININTRAAGRLAVLCAVAAVAAGCASSGGLSSNASSAGQPRSSTASSAGQPTSAAQTTVSAGGAHAAGTTAARPHAAPSADRPSSSGAVARADAHARGGPSTTSGARAQARGGSSTTSGARAQARGGSPAASVSKPPAVAAGPLLTSFSGSGSEAIGALSEKTGVVLQWSTSSPPLQIFNSHGFLLLVSNLPSGRVGLAPGEYKGLRVGAKGPWTIQIHASA